MAADGVGRIAVRHAPLDRAFLEIDRGEHAVWRLDDGESLDGKAAFTAASALS